MMWMTFTSVDNGCMHGKRCKICHIAGHNLYMREVHGNYMKVQLAKFSAGRENDLA